ncbi:MAG: glycoside hydrolase family 30 protein [Chitinophagaceae bacterium]|nr:glycoside hydrolase family 30 protein [Chitinophagaceae bacterium]
MKKNMPSILAGLVMTVYFCGCNSGEEKKPTNSGVPGAGFSTAGKSVQVYTTADTGNLRLSLTGTKAFAPAGQPLESNVSIFVNPDKTFQTFLGIGGAITDASAEVFAKLPEAEQQKMLKAYYDPQEGIGYTLVRTTIHSCDFSSGSYTYITEGDSARKTFSIEYDKKYRIPLIKKATEAAGGKLTFYASPWSPPAFMKTNNNMLQGGKLLPQYGNVWAQYFAKFIKAYEAAGVPVWGLTIQNEPMAVQRWESCIYTAEEERDFLKNHLGPVMKQEGLGDKKIIVWDHNRDMISERANIIFGDPEAARYAWGIGFHWYEIWAGGDPLFENIKNVHEAFPDKNLMFTEGCNEVFNAGKLQYWPNAERYGRSMINDFNNGTVGWTDWNILLDENGGPNHVGNFCFAPLHADIKNGALIYTPSYYYIGHFSKFIRPNAKRVSTSSSRSHLLATSFLNENGKMATVVMNQTDKPVMYNLFIGTQAVELSILPHAIQTMVY